MFPYSSLCLIQSRNRPICNRENLLLLEYKYIHDCRILWVSSQNLSGISTVCLVSNNFWYPNSKLLAKIKLSALFYHFSCIILTYILFLSLGPVKVTAMQEINSCVHFRNSTTFRLKSWCQALTGSPVGRHGKPGPNPDCARPGSSQNCPDFLDGWTWKILFYTNFASPSWIFTSRSWSWSII